MHAFIFAIKIQNIDFDSNLTILFLCFSVDWGREVRNKKRGFNFFNFKLIKHKIHEKEGKS